MPTEKICPTCGKPLDENALMGLCPECLLRAGFGTIDTRPDDAAKSPAFVPPTPEELARYFPDLEIIELLGRGGMGAVYKARQKRLERLVALKILPPGIGQAPSFADRFEREAKALAQLHHPNIVTLYDSGQVDGLFYFFMEFVDGVNLRQLLDHGRLSPKEALAIVPQICDALQFAHDRGIIHRDIKPENILLNKAGQVKIADFGVAKIVARELTETPGTDAPNSEMGQTEAGKVIGTPQYMAPEQLSHPLDVDNRADIYALGVVFYQMLTGELPVGKFEPPSRKAQTDVRLDEVVQRALEKKPELRYQQAGEMKTQVETIAGSGAPPFQTNPGNPSGSASRRLEREVPGPSRFSRAAIVGAAWSPFFFAAAAFLRFEHRTSFPDGYNLVAQLLIFLSFGACFGTTILGWTAVSQIHRSAGKLCGLGLALFDGLFFPLLALDYAIAFFINSAGIAFHLWTQEYDEVSNSWLTILSVIAWIIVDFIMIRWCWRAVNKPVETIAGSGAPPFQTNPGNPSRAGRYVGPILRWLSIAFSVFALTVLSGIFYTYEVLPNIYSATAEIQVIPRHPANPNGADSSSDPTSLQSEIEVMQSPDFLAPIITDLNLDKIWAKRVYHSGLDTLPDQDSISYLQSILKIDWVRGTNIVRITAFSEVSQEAADIANAVADRYIAVRKANYDEAVKDAEKRLTDQIAQQQKMVDDATAKVAQMRQDLAQKGIAIPSELQADLDARQKDLLTAQEDYDARRVLMQSVNNLPDDQFISTLDSLGRLPPDIAALRLDVLKENTDITGLLNNGFSEGDLQIVALRAKVAAEEQEIKHLVAGSRNNLKVDAEMAKSRVDLFQKEVDDLKNKTALGDASNALMPFSEALRNLEEQQKELDLLQVRLQQLDTENHLQEGSAAIVARAEPPEYPALPRHALNIAISVIVGFILSVGLASLVEFWFWLSAAPSVTTGDNKSPAASSLPQPPSSPKGRTLALVGAILQPASILGMILAALWQISGMESLRAQGPVGINDVANVVSITLVASAVSMIAFFVGLVLLCLALAVSRYRAKWFFWFLALYSWPLLLLFPFGTAAGIFFLIYCLSRRHEFPGA